MKKKDEDVVELMEGMGRNRVEWDGRVYGVLRRLVADVYSVWREGSLTADYPGGFLLPDYLLSWC